jgi:hypothetical protein
MAHATPYETTLRNLTVPAGKTVYGFTVKLPYAGFVKKLVVRQVSGPSVGFTVDLYRAKVVETSEGSATSTLHADLARIIPSQTGTAGNSVVLLVPDYGYVYMNSDGGLSPGGERQIYLAISHAAQASVTKWDVAIGIVSIDR